MTSPPHEGHPHPIGSREEYPHTSPDRVERTFTRGTAPPESGSNGGHSPRQGRSGTLGWLATIGIADGRGRDAPWTEVSACVAGIGVSGFAAADTLCQLGARVTVIDRRDGDAERRKGKLLELLGAEVLLGEHAAETPPAGTHLVITSPGWRPDAPLLAAAAAAGLPLWGEVELAWRLRGPAAAPWLIVTGTNGKTTTTRMLASMLQAAGVRATAAGNIGTPLLEVMPATAADDAATGKPVYDALAVELSSYQLHWSASIHARAAAVLNLAPDHLDWHGSAEDYYAAKGKAYQGCEIAGIYNAADPATELLLREAEVADGCRAIGFTLDLPDVGMVGIVDGVLADRAFTPDRRTAAAELAAVADVTPYAPHNVANALAAAALARAYGVEPRAVRDGLRGFRPEPHRIATIGEIGGVTYVDDSKATNAHAAAASLSAYDHVVWVAGGLAKGARFDDLVAGAAGRLRGAVLLGADRDLIREALARHAPDVPVAEVESTDTEVMDQVVGAAHRLAKPGDTVLLAPACASWDMFASYGERGDKFAAAVRRLTAGGA
jgi:UDP-N-acetylmuramoylalanine--D-glutamate ligase